MRPPSLLLIALLATVLLTPACADGFDLRFGGLQVDQLEQQILVDLERELVVDLESVDCEEDVQPRVGDVFRCIVRAVDDDSIGIVQVTQVDDQGQVEWELIDVQVPGS